MATNYVQPGKVITLTAPADVSSGDIVNVGKIVGIATHAAGSGEPVEVATEGVWEVAKTSAQAWATVGLEIYVAAGVATTVAGSNVLLGVNVEPADNPSGTGLVRLNGVFGVPSAAQMAAGDA